MKKNEIDPKSTQPRKRRIRHKKKSLFTRDDQVSILELYDQEDQNNLLNLPFKPKAVPAKLRKGTDQLCILIYAVLFLFLLLVGFIFMQQGDTRRLSSGVDFRAEICGSEALIDKPYQYFLTPTKDLNVALCVHQCPNTTGTQICMYDTDHLTPTIFCYVQMSSDQIGRVCLPQEPVTRAFVDQALSDTQNQVKRVFSDLRLSWELIIISLMLIGGAAYWLSYLLSFEEIILYEVWIAIWGTIVSLCILALIFMSEKDRVIKQRCLFGVDKHDCGGDRASIFSLLSNLTLMGTVGYLFYIITLFNRINLGIGLLKAASKVVKVLKQLRFFSFIIIILGLIVMAFCLISIIYGLSIGDTNMVLGKDIDGGVVMEYKVNVATRQLLLLPAFMMIFLLMFLLHINEMFNCYALSVWFFNKQKDVVDIPIKVVVKEILMHHLGSCFILTLLQLIFTVPKTAMHLVRHVLRSLPQTSLIVRFIQGSCLCCLSTHQNFLRFVSNHAMVQIAVWSESYGLSSKLAYFLLKRNNQTTNSSELDFLVEFILFQIKLSTCLIMSLPMYVYLSAAQKTIVGELVSHIESPTVPTLFVFGFGFFFATVFLGAYDICAKTVIQLYFMDKEMFYAEQRYTEKFISDFMEYFGKEEEHRIYVKAKKLMKYNAKIVPEDYDEDINEEDEVSSEEEEDTENQFKPNEKSDPFSNQNIIQDVSDHESFVDDEEQEMYKSKSNLTKIPQSGPTQKRAKIAPEQDFGVGSNVGISQMLKVNPKK